MERLHEGAIWQENLERRSGQASGSCAPSESRGGDAGTKGPCAQQATCNNGYRCIGVHARVAVQRGTFFVQAAGLERNRMMAAGMAYARAMMDRVQA